MATIRLVEDHRESEGREPVRGAHGHPGHEELQDRGKRHLLEHLPSALGDLDHHERLFGQAVVWL